MLLEFEKKLACFVEAHGLFGSAAKVVLAVSGGADSTALLYATQALRAENVLSAELVCAHINHQLRGAEADADEAFVVAQTARLKLAVTTKRVDVRGFARRNKLSTETAARQLRMKALTEIARAHHCDRIATGHQENDNAETVLHRLVRGTGFRGLGGIWPKRVFADGVAFVRPLLCVTRDEVIEYLQARHLTWRRDRTNADCIYRRNYIRHRLLPALQQDCRDSLVEALSELAHSARTFYGRVCKQADAAWPSSAECTDESATLDLKEFNAQSPPVRMEMIRRSLTHIGSGQRDLTRRHYERIVQLAGQDVTGKRIELPGGFLVRRQYSKLIFSLNRVVGCRVGFSPPMKVNDQTDESVRLNVPGQTTFGKHLIETTICAADAGLESAGLVSGRFDRRSAHGGPERKNPPSDKQRLSYAARCLDGARHDGRRGVERFDLEKVKRPLTVRFRRPGDRFVPLGLGGDKKIGKFLTAQRIPHEVRRNVIIVEDRDKIICLWPLRISERAKVTADTRQILQLQITHSGDP